MRIHLTSAIVVALLASPRCTEDNRHIKTVEFSNLQKGKSIQIISNQSAKLAHYNLAINGKEFIHSLDELISCIDKGRGKSRKESVWMYTSKNSYHFVPLTEKKWYHDPIIFFNSVGFGYCDDVSIINSIIWNGMGYSSRIWNINLGTHIVSEVSEDGITWELFDSDLGLVFNEGGGALSIDRLIEMQTIDQAALKINGEINEYRKKYISDHMLSWDSFKYNYASLNNYVETSDLEDFKSDSIYDYRLGLPPGAQLLIGHKVGQPLSTSKIEEQNWLVPDYYNLIIRAENIAKYSFMIPLVLQSVSGKGTFEVDGVEYFLPEDNKLLSNIINEWDSSIRKVTTINVVNLELIYLLNPLKFGEFNSVKVTKLD